MTETMTDNQRQIIDKFIVLWFEYWEQDNKTKEAIKKSETKNYFYKENQETRVELYYLSTILENISLVLQSLKKYFDLPLSFNLGNYKPFYTVVKSESFLSMEKEAQINKIFRIMLKANKETHNKQ